ncbi:MAG TPA: YHS domain-containing protein [Tepidisphaeraceae bacterium]|jgi:YHS domain-containing protein|nr:YHS domain-containing protein [Tepidisphaeraceae bacterium]
MQRVIFSLFAFLALSGAVLSAADKVEKKDDKKKPETPAATQPAKPINTFCAVDRDNPVDPTVPTVTYKGKVIGFCCEDCVPEFKKNPEKYMKDLK